MRTFARSACLRKRSSSTRYGTPPPCISANNVRVAIEPNRTPSPPPSYQEEAIHNTQIQGCMLTRRWPREENEPIVQTHGLRTVLLLTVPKARYPKASLVPTSACAAKDATFNRRQHHESPMSSQHGGRLCSVEVLESELLGTPVSEQSIGNCEMAVPHQRYHTRHEGSLEKSTVTRIRQRSLSHVPKHPISTVGKP